LRQQKVLFAFVMVLAHFWANISPSIYCAQMVKSSLYFITTHVHANVWYMCRRATTHVPNIYIFIHYPRVRWCISYYWCVSTN
jgi:hypothetical protein